MAHFSVADCNPQNFLNHHGDIRPTDVSATTTTISASQCWHCAAKPCSVFIIVRGCSFGAFCSARCGLGFIKDPLNYFDSRETVERETMTVWGIKVGDVVPAASRALLKPFGGPLEPTTEVCTVLPHEVPMHHWLFAERDRLKSSGAEISAFEVHRNSQGGIARPTERATPPVTPTPSGAPPHGLNILADYLRGVQIKAGPEPEPKPKRVVRRTPKTVSK